MSGDRFYLIPAGLAAVMLLFGGTMIGVGKLLTGAAEERRSWPSTEGVVITNWRATKPTVIRDPKTGNTRESWGAILEYTYEVDGREYTGNGSGYGRIDPADSQTRFAVGTKVPVFYDPEDPSHAALTLDEGDPGDITTPFLWLGFGSMLIGMPFAYGAYRVWRGRAVIVGERDLREA
jgi:hypothetical protein